MISRRASLVDVQDPAGNAMGCAAPNGAIGMGLGFEATRITLGATTVGAPVPGACGRQP